ncbi:hypothetical protein SAMN04515671_3776 [Nakamurella panacisegetis]|uniref:DNA binding domain-containing protein, excisionase family n=1 Tax=Nakamurella panacisegetis TaxID=1090615 RepID=A0A1H0RW54_9ACTN|nr:helix-turn-helix domain-containing protein [Nakamurella panacisegetis]SDP33640.1 hypothetical protein SAMN04515671_3776 [Nakamurella panacisegetis]
MNVTIDLVADAASMVWGERAKGASQVVDVPGRGVRLLLSAAGDVVGVEVLGWSQRTADPSEVAVRVAGVAEILDDSDPLAVALAELDAAPQVPVGKPVDEHGQPMLGVREAAELIGKDRSWIIRQLNAGALRGRKIGSEWWIAKDWAIEYRDRTGPAPTARLAH